MKRIKRSLMLQLIIAAIGIFFVPMITAITAYASSDPVTTLEFNPPRGVTCPNEFPRKFGKLPKRPICRVEQGTSLTLSVSAKINGTAADSYWLNLEHDQGAVVSFSPASATNPGSITLTASSTAATGEGWAHLRATVRQGDHNVYLVRTFVYKVTAPPEAMSESQAQMQSLIESDSDSTPFLNPTPSTISLGDYQLFTLFHSEGRWAVRVNHSGDTGTLDNKKTCRTNPPERAVKGVDPNQYIFIAGCAAGEATIWIHRRGEPNNPVRAYAVTVTN